MKILSQITYLSPEDTNLCAVVLVWWVVPCTVNARGNRVSSFKRTQLLPRTIETVGEIVGSTPCGKKSIKYTSIIIQNILLCQQTRDHTYRLVKTRQTTHYLRETKTNFLTKTMTPVHIIKSRLSFCAQRKVIVMCTKVDIVHNTMTCFSTQKDPRKSRASDD